MTAQWALIEKKHLSKNKKVFGDKKKIVNSIGMEQVLCHRVKVKALMSNPTNVQDK